jgi:hypothetical protein
MKKIDYLIFVTIVLSMSGCTKSVPSCKSAEAQEKVVQLLSDHAYAKPTITNIKTVSKNKQTLSAECIGELSTVNKENNEKVNLPVAFKLTKNADGYLKVETNLNAE